MTANYMALYYLYRYGRFRFSRFRFPFFLLLALTMIGILFQIQHWEGASLIFIGTSFGIAIVYTIWFFTKPGKTLNDTLKVLCVNTWVLLPLLSTWSYSYFLTPLVSVFNTILLHTTYIHFKLVEEKKQETEEPEWDFDKTQEEPS